MPPYSWNSCGRTSAKTVQCPGCDSKAAKAAGFLTPVGCHTWRATGITIYLENDGRLEHAQQMAGHESPRTTKLYDRTKDEITLSEVESGCDVTRILDLTSCVNHPD